MYFSNIDWGFLISIASAMVATIKIVLIVFSMGRDSKRRAKLEHHELFRMYKNIKTQIRKHPDLDRNLKTALIILLETVEEAWGTSDILKQFSKKHLAKSNIQNSFSNMYLSVLENLEINLNKTNVKKEYISHILSCIKSYGTNFKGEIDYIIFSDAHTDGYQMAVMLLDVNAAVITSAIPDLINVGENNDKTT